MPGAQAVSADTAAKLADLPPKARERVIRRLTANAWEELPPPASVLELQAEASIRPAPDPIADMLAASDARGDLVCEAFDNAVAAFNTPVVAGVDLGAGRLSANSITIRGMTLDAGATGIQTVQLQTYADSINAYLNTNFAGEPNTPRILQQVEAAMAAMCEDLTHKQNAVWGGWSQNCYTSINCTQSTAWSAWTTGTIMIKSTVAATTGTYIYCSADIQNVWANWQQPIRRKESEAQRRAREEAEVRAAAEYAKQQEAASKEAVKVKARAEKILVRHLSEDQKKVLAEKGYFDEDINGKTYRIWRSTHGNIRELDKDKKVEVASLCVQPSGVPTDDAVLAQLLWLRADEKALLRVANRRQLRP